MIYKTLSVALVAASAMAELSSTPPASLKMMFEAFKKDHAKSYATMEEEANRYAIFVENLRTIDARNAEEMKAGGTAVHGINQFSDLTHEEFKARYLTADIKLKSSNAPVADVPAYTGSQSSVDWTGVYTTPVKNQGYCG